MQEAKRPVLAPTPKYEDPGGSDEADQSGSLWGQSGAAQHHHGILATDSAKVETIFAAGVTKQHTLIGAVWGRYGDKYTAQPL